MFSYPLEIGSFSMHPQKRFMFQFHNKTKPHAFACSFLYYCNLVFGKKRDRRKLKFSSCERTAAFAEILLHSNALCYWVCESLRILSIAYSMLAVYEKAVGWKMLAKHNVF